MQVDNDPTSSSDPLIYRLPNEIFILVFKYTIRPERRDIWPNGEFTISHVSRRWRALATNTPSLWCNVRLSTTKSSHLADLYLARSRNLLLDVSAVLRLTHRPYQKIALFVFPLFNTIRVPALEKFVLSVKEQTGYRFIADGDVTNNDAAKAKWFSGGAPKLTSISVSERDLQTVNFLPLFDNLTTFTISGPPAPRLPPMTFNDLYTILLHLPFLSELVLDKVFFHPLFPTGERFTDCTAQFPMLRFLSLSIPCCTSFVVISAFSVIVAPELQHLSLRSQESPMSDKRTELQQYLTTHPPPYPILRSLLLDCPFEKAQDACALMHAFPSVQVVSLTRMSEHVVCKALTTCPSRMASCRAHQPQKLWPHLHTLVLEDWSSARVASLIKMLHHRKAIGMPIPELKIRKADDTNIFTEDVTEGQRRELELIVDVEVV
ncbi:hypothetical protein SERLADRAFT_408709 [Serpula lacrymans var. lacrymans S7.9]|uniref:Uncharacterized protein n=1 Tax=Serpula lacrymans var. lacrymans (strain S7.9) TaxID=578457 RepID=F8NVX6_SERL9|nr:uncharacterized protein SERLADRAFT_408709 [Serpula lacrymans var. lacrymans S7.9]EGO24910.1 hypothetical protein SERLADRAFT_408709 [Serpula lacrymans var. lacrymans S7.9]